MKRYNAKAMAAAAAAANMARNSSALQPVSLPLEAPPQGPVLYVDVVKNVPKEVPATAPPPPPLATPEFSIFREDFPALPGGTRPPSVSSVPDDWTSMISDDEDEILGIPESPDISSSPPGTTEDDLMVDEPKSLYSSRSHSTSDETSSTSYPDDENLYECDDTSIKSAFTENESSSISSFDVNGEYAEYIPKGGSFLYEHSAGELLGEVSLIFSKQFIQEGVRQRAVNGSIRRLRPTPSATHGRCADTIPPGFDKSRISATLMTHYTGMPMGGVIFGWHHSTEQQDPANKAPGSVVEGEFGLLGLAGRLGLAHDNPDIIPMVYGEDDLISTELETDYRTHSSQNLRASFAGPFQGFRCGANELNSKGPIYMPMASRLGMVQPKMYQMEAELLFYFFYNCPGDMMQMLAAAELAERSWRYNMKECLWIRRQPDNPNYVYIGFQESGEYNYFNQFHWKILPRHFNLDPDQIERTLSKEELLEKYGFHPQMY